VASSVASGGGSGSSVGGGGLIANAGGAGTFGNTPTGNIWLIHGTFSSSVTWSQDFRSFLVGTDGPFAGATYHFGDWSDTGGWFNSGAGNNVIARMIGANNILQDILRVHEANPNTPIHLIGHSHGGNVGLALTNMLAGHGVNVDTLITIATPVRADFQLDAGVTVGQHINVYSNIDPIQIAGGQLLQVGYNFRFVPAGRTFDNANNIRVTGFRNPATVHNNMHSNVDVWRNFIMPAL
jgi:pimeloyl-ACP methyl ester carboxylesterase